METCAKCGISNLSVTITATCQKCKDSVSLCHTCKLAWSIKDCPSCGASSFNANWSYRDTSGSGDISDDMLSYLENSSISPKNYVTNWNAVKEKRLEEREKDGDNAHRGISLPANEVQFLRKMEDFLFEPIITIADDRSNYVVIENDSVVKMRFYNADIRGNMPDSISSFVNLREFWYEKQRNGKGSLSSLPDSFAELKSLETIVLKRTSAKIPSPEKLINVKKLAIPTSNDIKMVFKFSNLEELSLSGCNLRDDDLENLGTLTTLKKLQLSNISINGSSFEKIPESLQKLTLLEELDVTGCTIGKFESNSWPDWMLKLPNLKTVHKNVDSLWGWGPIETVLHERNPDVHLGNILDPMRASRQMNLSDMKQWWKENSSEALQIGWTGISSRV